MLTVLIVFFFHIAPCTASPSPPRPINVSFSSVSLRNVLHWFPGNGTYTDDLHFTVEYAIYGDSIQSSKGKRVNWRAVRHCTEIARTWCDLTSETSDENQGYHARVCAVDRGASSKWALIRRRFDPKTDTTLGPPLVLVEIENNSAIITLKGPMRYPPNNHTPGLSMESLYPEMIYNLTIRNTQHNQMYHFPVVSSPYKYRLMEYNTEYCFSAQSKFLSMPIRCQSSAWYCITTPQDPVIEQLKRVVVGIVVPALCICMIFVAAHLLYHYLSGKDRRSPFILDPPSFHKPPILLPPENPNLIPISVINHKPSENIDVKLIPTCLISPLQVADSPPSYSPQMPEALSEPEEPSDDLSIDYGGVIVVPQIVGGDEETRQERHDDGARSVENGHSAGAYAPQANSSHAFRQSNMKLQTRAHLGMSTHVQALPWAPVSSVLSTESQAPLHSFGESAMGEVSKNKQDRELQDIMESKTPQTGLFHLPLNRQTNEEVERGGERGEEMRLSTDREEAIDGVEHENVPLLPAYAPRYTTNMSVSHSDQGDALSDEYGIISANAMQETAGGYYDNEDDEEEDGANINWDSKTRKLMLSEVRFNHEGGLAEPLLSERRIEEDQEVDVMGGELRLENVFVRQASEEVSQKESEHSGDTGGEVSDILDKWGLVIPMDQ